MKVLLIIWVLVMLTFSCSGPSEKSKSENSNSPKEEVLKENKIDTVISENTKVTDTVDLNQGSHPKTNNFRITDLPFGCEEIVKHKFPKTWQMKDENTLKVGTSEFYYESLFKCLHKKINKGPKINQPEISKIEFVELPSEWEIDDSRAKTVDTCRYRLPDFGPYEIYYSSSYTKPPYPEKENVVFEHQPPVLLEFGNLILINSKNREAKIINISMAVGAPFSFYDRVFYIDKDYSILIMEFDNSEGFVETNQKFKIQLFDNGEIKINEIK